MCRNRQKWFQVTSGIQSEHPAIVTKCFAWDLVNSKHLINDNDFLLRFCVCVLLVHLPREPWLPDHFISHYYP